MSAIASDQGRDWVEPVIDTTYQRTRTLDPPTALDQVRVSSSGGFASARLGGSRHKSEGYVRNLRLVSANDWHTKVSSDSPIDASFCGAAVAGGHLFYLVYLKRIFDVLIASVLLIVVAPLMLVIVPWIMLDSSGSAFYRQRRVGRDRQEFTIYKFRSMVLDAHYILEKDPALTAQYAVHWKLVTDPRVTRSGGFLRRTSLDELPQLVNVLKGDMSIVGPRPVQPNELVQCYGHNAEVVTSVRPGLTGLWQVSGRSAVSYEKRTALDIAYVQNRSFRLDWHILLKTIPAVLFQRGAH